MCIKSEETVKKEPAMNTILYVKPIEVLRKAKHRMEDSFIDDCTEKLKLFKATAREEVEGEYTFTVCVGLIGDVIEIKETVTTCKMSEVEEGSIKSDDTYKPESDVDESESEKKRKENKHIECWLLLTLRNKSQITMGVHYLSTLKW